MDTLFSHPPYRKLFWTYGLWVLAAITLGAVAAALPYTGNLKTLAKLAVIICFGLLLFYDMEWAYLFFILLIWLMPSRFNKMYLSLGAWHMMIYDPLLLLLFCFWLIHMFRERKSFLLSGHIAWLFSMLGAVLVSLFFSVNHYSSTSRMAAGLTYWLRIGLFYYMTYHILFYRKDSLKYFYTLAAASFILAAYGLYSYFFLKSGFAFAADPVKMFSYEKRLVVGSLIGGGPNTLAACLTLTMPMIFAHWLFLKNFFQKVLFLGVLITQGSMMILTFSRAGALSLCLALLLVILSIAKRPVKIFAGLSIFIMLLLLLWRFMPGEVQQRFQTLSQPKHRANIVRFQIWEQAWHYVQTSPWVGTGPNCKFKTSSTFKETEKIRVFHHAHNWVLNTLVEIGILGTFILFGYLAGILIKSFIHLRRSGVAGSPAYQYGIWAGVVAFSLHGLVDYLLWQPRVTMIFWLLVLLLVPIKTLTSKEINHEHSLAS